MKTKTNYFNHDQTNGQLRTITKEKITFKNFKARK